MPIETTCPSCQRPLRVPDDLIDHPVRCPECGTEWVAAAPTQQSDSIALLEPGPSAIPSPAPETFRESIAPPSQSPDDHIRESPGAAGSPTPAPSPPNADDEGDDEDEEFERDLQDRWRRRVSSRSVTRARNSLLGPSIGIFIAAGLVFLDALLNLAVGALGMHQMSATPGLFGAALLGPGIYVLHFAWCAAKGTVMLVGGLQLFKACRYSWSMAACIAAMTPSCDCCFLIGLPFGIWGLYVLLQPDVKRAFQYRPRADQGTDKTPSDDILED